MKGYFFAAIAAAAYGTNPIFAIPLYREGMDVSSVLFMRYAMAVVIMFSFMLITERKALVVLKSVSLKEWCILFGMGVLMVLSSILLFESYRYLPAGIASTLLFCYPVMVALMMTMLYGEKLSRRSLLCLMGAFLGVAALSKDESGMTISLWGMLLVMLSSLSYAVYLVYIKRGPMRHLPSSSVTMVVLVSGLAVLALQTFCGSGLTLPIGGYGWFNVTGLGLLPTVVSLYFTSRAIAEVGSTNTAIFGALEPLTAVVLGIFILDEALTLRMSVGMLLIFVSVTILMMRRSAQRIDSEAID